MNHVTQFLNIGIFGVVALLLFFFGTPSAHAVVNIATTTIYVTICGDQLVGVGEECDVPADTGAYSTTIIGRQCNSICKWAPYCGDAVLQTIYGEECDDGNNDDGDYCSADCTEERADAGGGSSGGGGSSSSGGQNNPLADTQVTIQGRAYPNTSVNILIDGEAVGSVRTNSRGEFLFNTESEPGTATLSFWANDSSGTRSTTFSTTFDVTQGAVTNVNGVLIPPTIRASKTAAIDPGEVIVLSGQTVPNVTVEVSIDNGKKKLTTTSDAIGNWSVDFNTGQVSIDTHTIKARFIEGSALRAESSYGTALSLFVGVEGKALSNSDLNRDGKVNLIDFSILIFWWGTPGGNSNPPADINGNARVGLEDFSILLFNWTG